MGVLGTSFENACSGWEVPLRPRHSNVSWGLQLSDPNSSHFPRERGGQRLLQQFQGESQGHEEAVACHFPSHDKWQDLRFHRSWLCSLVTKAESGHFFQWYFLSVVYTLNVSQASLQYRGVKGPGLVPNKFPMEDHLLENWD